jgi:hypothetical protein
MSFLLRGLPTERIHGPGEAARARESRIVVPTPAESCVARAAPPRRGPQLI